MTPTGIVYVFQATRGPWKGWWYYAWFARTHTGQSAPYPTREAAERAATKGRSWPS